VVGERQAAWVFAAAVVVPLHHAGGLRTGPAGAGVGGAGVLRRVVSGPVTNLLISSWLSCAVVLSIQ